MSFVAGADLIGQRAVSITARELAPRERLGDTAYSRVRRSTRLVREQEAG